MWMVFTPCYHGCIQQNYVNISSARHVVKSKTSQCPIFITCIQNLAPSFVKLSSVVDLLIPRLMLMVITTSSLTLTDLISLHWPLSLPIMRSGAWLTRQHKKQKGWWSCLELTQHNCCTMLPAACRWCFLAYLHGMKIQYTTLTRMPIPMSILRMLTNPHMVMIVMKTMMLMSCKLLCKLRNIH